MTETVREGEGEEVGRTLKQQQKFYENRKKKRRNEKGDG